MIGLIQASDLDPLGPLVGFKGDGKIEGDNCNKKQGSVSIHACYILS